MRAKMIASGEVPKDDAPESCRIIASQADRVTAIVRQLLDFARRRTPKRAEAELRELSERAATFLSTLAKKSNVRVVVDPTMVRDRLKSIAEDEDLRKWIL
jgi:signal transduction histidine kinase